MEFRRVLLRSAVFSKLRERGFQRLELCGLETKCTIRFSSSLTSGEAGYILGLDLPGFFCVRIIHGGDKAERSGTAEEFGK